MLKLLRVQNRKQRYKGFLVMPKIAERLIGKIELIEQLGISEALLSTYIKYGYVEVIAGIQESKRSNWPIQTTFEHLLPSTYPRQAMGFSSKYRCNRCQTTETKAFIQFRCAKCQKICVYCRHCIAMGRIASCSKLIKWRMQVTHKRNGLYTGQVFIAKENHAFTWEGQLTPLQEKASMELAAALKARRQHVIHAVCGAGKTELLFLPIFEALKRGERVCLATPRTDVVLELYPRFQQAFRNTNIQALYGGAEKSPGYHSLILTTTHQLYRFERAFDTIIVDEADAFPYTFDAALQRAVEKAKKGVAGSAIVTATPSLAIKRKVEKGEASSSFIPKRYHDFPLPVPRAESLWFYERVFLKGHIPPKLTAWIDKQFQLRCPVLLFFPSIHLMETAYPLFHGRYPDLLMVHAEDPERKEKVMQLREEKIRGLLTTTILERGVTIKNVQVAVIGAESKIFEANALIQIAGRVGRNKQFPQGEIVFFHHGLTTEIDLAIETIKGYNKTAGFDREAGEATYASKTSI